MDKIVVKMCGFKYKIPHFLMVLVWWNKWELPLYYSTISIKAFNIINGKCIV